MKKFIDIIEESFKQLSDGVKTIILVGIFIIVFILSKNANSYLVIILGIISAIVMIVYVILSILKHEDVTKTLIYLILVIMAIAIIITYHFKSIGLDFNAFGVIFPIILLFFFIIGYINVKKSGNKEKIRQVKLSLILAVPVLTLALIFFIYVLFFK